MEINASVKQCINTALDSFHSNSYSHIKENIKDRAETVENRTEMLEKTSCKTSF